MLTEITTKEIMTTGEASKKYSTKYFIMIITEVVDQGDNDLGYVIYTADTRKELSQVSREKYIDKMAAFKQGGAAEPFPTIDRVVYHAQV
jgi:hypothetical protein